MDGAGAARQLLINGLLDYENPRTYEQIFTNLDERHVTVVTGEADNTLVHRSHTYTDSKGL